jgi:tetratricopeptide (TPR) repeat protein
LRLGANHRLGLRLPGIGVANKGPALAAVILAVLSVGEACSSSKKPTSAEMLLNERMAAVLLRDGQCSDAEKAYLDVIKLDSKNPELYDGLGVAQLCQGKVKESIEALDRAVKILPNKALYRIHRACAHTEAGHYSQADEDFKVADASAAPEDRLEIALNRGRLRQKQADYTRAEGEFTVALALDPQSYPARMGRGVAREAKGDVSSAAEDYLEAVRLQPKNPEANLRLGLALLTLKKYALGRRYLERTVELDPGGDLGARARSLLDKTPSS